MQQSVNRVGQRLGHYTLIQRLGKGGFAEVYLGEHLHLKTQAAVKVLLTHLTQEAVDTFRHEAQMIARLRHPSIVQVYDFGIEDEIAYLVMDYAPHGTLRQQYPKGAILPPATIVNYVKQVAEALQYAHEQRFIHRDVKPENMLVGPRQEILLSDFGIALTTHTTNSTSTQDIAGTVAYMAPEQIQGRARPASDQYALGIVTYEWFCGNRPFQGSFTEVAVQHTIALPPPLRQHVPTLSPEIEQVVLTALQKDPQQRFPNVRAFAQALEQSCLRQGATTDPNASQQFSTYVISSRALPQQPPSGLQGMPASYSQQAPQQPPSGLQGTPVSYSQQAPQQTPAGWQGTPASLSQQTPQQTPAGLQGMPVSYSQQAPTTSYEFAAPPVETPALTPDSLGWAPRQRSLSRRRAVAGITSLVAIASGGLAWAIVMRKEKATPTAVNSPAVNSPNVATPTTSAYSTPILAMASIVTYRGHTDDVVGIDWSPSGASIATVSLDGTSRVWGADTGRDLSSYSSQIIPAQSNDDALAVRWSRNGEQRVVGFADGTVQGVGPHSKMLFSYSVTPVHVTSLAYSPDEKNLAVASSDGTVQVIEVASGKRLARFTGHIGGVTAVEWSHNGKYIVSSSEDATAQVWDAVTGQALLIFKEHTRKVSSVAWSADDSRIVSCGWDNAALIWDAQSGRVLLEYRKHTAGWLNAVEWSHNGKYIASAGEVGSVTGNVYIGTRGVKSVNMHVWEAETGNTYLTYESLPINALMWSLEDRRVATACTNGVAQVWRVI